MAQQDRFAALLSEVARAVKRRQASEVCCGELTLEQFQTLHAAHQAGRPTMSFLSAELGVDLSTMSRNVSVLERDGYLTRARSEDDARVVNVRLTSKGRRSLETLRCTERDVLRDAYDRLTPEERSLAVKVLDSLRVCLARAEAPDGACCAPSTRKGAS